MAHFGILCELPMPTVNIDQAKALVKVLEAACMTLLGAFDVADSGRPYDGICGQNPLKEIAHESLDLGQVILAELESEARKRRKKYKRQLDQKTSPSRSASGKISASRGLIKILWSW